MSRAGVPAAPQARDARGRWMALPAAPATPQPQPGGERQAPNRKRRLVAAEAKGVQQEAGRVRRVRKRA